MPIDVNEVTLELPQHDQDLSLLGYENKKDAFGPDWEW